MVFMISLKELIKTRFVDHFKSENKFQLMFLAAAERVFCQKLYVSRIENLFCLNILSYISKSKFWPPNFYTGKQLMNVTEISLSSFPVVSYISVGLFLEAVAHRLVQHTKRTDVISAKVAY